MNQKVYGDDDITRLGETIAEHIVDEFRAGFEAIEEIKHQTSKIPQLATDIATLKADMSTVKFALLGTHRDLRKLTKRVDRTVKPDW